MHNKPVAETQLGSFDEIVLPHLDAAHNLARWLVRNNDDAEDVVQEACLRAFRYLTSFRGGNARAWVLSIVRTTAFRWLHKNRAQQPATEFDEGVHSEGSEALDPEALLLQDVDAQLLEQAINNLPDRLRAVLVLREQEELSYKEIAEVVGVPMGTVMSTLFRARERFRCAVSDLVRQQARPKCSADFNDCRYGKSPVPTGALRDGRDCAQRDGYLADYLPGDRATR